MAFIQRDDIVEDLPAGTSDPAFGDSILPGSLYASPFRLQARGLQERNHFGIELGIVIQNGVTVRLLSGKCLPKLLITQFSVGWAVTLQCRIFRR